MKARKSTLCELNLMQLELEFESICNLLENKLK